MKLTIIIGMLGLLALLAACGSSEPAASPPAASRSAAAPAAAAAPAPAPPAEDQTGRAVDQAAPADRSGQAPDRASPSDRASAPAAGEAGAEAAPKSEASSEAASEANPEANPEAAVPGLVPAADDPAPLQAPEAPDAKAAEAALGANDFAFDLARNLAAELPADANLVASPFSVWLPLAALAGAATDGARPGLLAALSAGGLSPGDLDRAAGRMFHGLTNQAFAERYPSRHQNPLKVANALFVAEGLTIREAFARRFLDFYRGSSFAVDFGAPGTPALVNAWISENTGGKITDLVGSFDPATVAALANAVYLSSAWLLPFEESGTKDGVFRSPSGDVPAKLMETREDLRYFEDDRIQAAELRLADHASMLIVLPKDDGAPSLVLADLSAARLASIMEGAEVRRGRVVLPRFKVSSGAVDLVRPLAALGVDLFDPDLAALTGGLVEGGDPVFLSGALHQAVVEVDEHGVTAAAATVMTAATSSFIQPQEPFELVCDRPFLFLLLGDAYDNPHQALFTGIVNKP